MDPQPVSRGDRAEGSSARPRVSAGLLMFRSRGGELEVFLAHPGGPIFARKDEGHWTIPKGEPDRDEDLFDTARREFEEEVGLCAKGPYFSLGQVVQKGGKIVFAWAFAGDWADGRPHRCNEFQMEWPPHSGVLKRFPEIDRVGFFKMSEARKKLKDSQLPFLDRLVELLSQGSAKSKSED